MENIKTFEAIKEKLDAFIEVNKPSDRYKETYEVEILWDSNDADYIPTSEFFKKENFEKDYVLKLALCYVGQDKRGDNLLFGGDWNTPRYGHYIEDNKYFPQLMNYLVEMDLVSYNDCGEPCHSIESVSIKYYDKDGKVSLISLPKFDILFQTKGEAVAIFNYCLNDFFKDENSEI